MSSLLNHLVRWGIVLKGSTVLHRFCNRCTAHSKFLHQHQESRIHQLYCRDDGSVAVSAIIKVQIPAYVRGLLIDIQISILHPT
jgi:ribosomal protein S27AE